MIEDAIEGKCGVFMRSSAGGERSETFTTTIRAITTIFSARPLIVSVFRVENKNITI